MTFWKKNWWVFFYSFGASEWDQKKQLEKSKPHWNMFYNVVALMQRPQPFLLSNQSTFIPELRLKSLISKGVSYTHTNKHTKIKLSLFFSQFSCIFFGFEICLKQNSEDTAIDISHQHNISQSQKGERMLCGGHFL